MRVAVTTTCESPESLAPAELLAPCPACGADSCAATAAAHRLPSKRKYFVLKINVLRRKPDLVYHTVHLKATQDDNFPPAHGSSLRSALRLRQVARAAARVSKIWGPRARFSPSVAMSRRCSRALW